MSECRWAGHRRRERRRTIGRRWHVVNGTFWRDGLSADRLPVLLFYGTKSFQTPLPAWRDRALRIAQGWRVDPADMAVGAAVDQVDATVAGVAEHHDSGAGHVEFHHGFAHRQLLQRGRRLGDDDRVER